MNAIVDGIKKSKNLKKALPIVYRASLDHYEKSPKNMERTIASYYSNGIMGKKKHKANYRSTSYELCPGGSNKHKRITIENCPVPRLVPYHRMRHFINSIDIGELHSVYDTLCHGLQEEEKVNGCYRDLEQLLLKLAKFYISNHNLYNILDFDHSSDVDYTFRIALGGDGAPFSKEDTACAWLVSFLNIGSGVLSSKENYLLFGANCSESCQPVTRFIEKLASDVGRIEKTIYHLTCSNGTYKVKFIISELPNDMKMLAYLGGELSNSATFFSTFGNVSLNTVKAVHGTFGTESSNTWHPWKYEHRIKVANAVEKFKKTVLKPKPGGQPLAESTKRSKITSFISQQKSRQEFVPLVGKIIDKAHVDPLHLKNNACALAHRELLSIACIDIAVTSVSSFLQLPHRCGLVKFVSTLRSKCDLGRLAKKVVKWFNETKGVGKAFEYRFTGQDSRRFLQSFMYLVDVLETGNSGTKQKKCHVQAFICLCLRDIVSLFSRLTISDEEVSRLKQLCNDYFRVNCFYQPSVNPTVWTIGHIVPAHTADMKQKYGMGLGLNSMEGREAKHISIATYSRNTSYNNRWKQIFVHEYVSLIWLRERGFNVSTTKAKTQTYIPKHCLLNDKFCYCGFEKCVSDAECRFCSHSLRREIKVRIHSHQH